MKKSMPDVRPEVTEEPNPWTESAVDPAAPQIKPEVEYKIEAPVPHIVKANQTHPDFDIDGLMTDFPTAKDLERFVFDETGVVLNLKGRANKLKYQVAMDVLNGMEVEAKFIGGENPYIDKAEMVPVEELKPVPFRDPTLPNEDQLQNTFVNNFIPHPDAEYRARSKKVQTLFRKYKNGMISYEVLGPIEPKPIGQKMDKFGNMRPEIMAWVDPRTGEQLVTRKDGTLTPQGRNLRAVMQKQRVNDSNYWNIWVDRDFVNVEGGELRNPWELDSE